MATSRIIVLLTLKPGKAAADYEQWARTTDLPTVNGLKAVEGFKVYQATGLLGGGAAPYDYVEVLDITDMDLFWQEAGAPDMAVIAAEFQEWANPIFITTRDLQP